MYVGGWSSAVHGFTCSKQVLVALVEICGAVIAVGVDDHIVDDVALERHVHSGHHVADGHLKLRREV